MRINEFWQEFIQYTGIDKDTKYLESFHFELTEKLANELLHLVLIGQKKATASSLPGYEIEGNRIPQAGDYSIVTDWEGNPRCVIRTTNVRIIPFRDITYDICKLEGEDDTLESWRKGHINFFEADGKELGYTFSEDMPVVFEEFEVVYQI
ncbi:MAG TPA: ASCH domain-containing protein [Lachnospiraceae bacterium]|nr:ASCH domain-containing protein [Lachnospiraceae bacterium]